MSTEEKHHGTVRVELIASCAGYIALAAIWFCIASIVGLAIARNGAITVSNLAGLLIPCAIGTGWVVWLRGFRVRISDGHISYRNGLYRETTVSLRSLYRAELTWVEWKHLGRVVKVPRIVIESAVGSTLLINPKPFSSRGVRVLLHILQRYRVTSR